MQTLDSQLLPHPGSSHGGARSRRIHLHKEPVSCKGSWCAWVCGSATTMGNDQRSSLTVRASMASPPSQTLQELLEEAVSSMTVRNVDGIELCPPGKRFIITMVASFVAMAGQFLMPGLAALCRDWQVLQALIICPFLLMLLYWSIFPESLRWLMATQQFESAKKLILYLTQKNCVSPESDIKGVMPELEKELSRRPKKVCIVKVVGTRNLWKNIVVLCVNSLTGYGIHHCFARSMMGHEVKVPLLENFYADYYTMASIALASCLAMCLVVKFLGRRGGLLLFMILTALASLLQLGLLNLIGKYSQHPDSGMSDSVKDKFSIAFSIVGMFASHAVGSLSVFFCAEITPTVIRWLHSFTIVQIICIRLALRPSPLSKFPMSVFCSTVALSQDITQRRICQPSTDG